MVCTLFSLAVGLKWSISNEFAKYKNRFFDNVIVSNIDLGGQTLSEAKQNLQNLYINPILEKKIEVSLEGKTFSATLKDFFKKSTLDETLTEALQLPSTLTTVQKYRLLHNDLSYTFNVSLSFDEASIDSFINRIASNETKASKPAGIYIDTKGNINITPGINGYVVDKSKLKVTLETAISSFASLKLTDDDFIIPTVPRITENQLKAVDALISSTTTYFTPSTSRATNIALCASVINDTFLMPGDTFSFNKLVGDTTLEKGYKNGATYANGTTIQTPGGGICQVSSTLYNALLKTDLKITERKPHSRPVTYVPLGLDATISWDTIDLSFQNTLGYPIYIKAYTENNALHVDLYSNHLLTEKTYELKSEVIETIPSPINYVYSSKLAKGTKQLAQSGKSGYKVRVTRQTYSNSKLVSIEPVSTDIYAATPTIYHIGR